MAKYEIEIPNLPEGFKPVGIGVKPGDICLYGEGVYEVEYRGDARVRLEVLDGYEAVIDRMSRRVTVRRRALPEGESSQC